MRLLHITATHLNPEGGVPVVLKKLVEKQNQLPNFQAMVISVTAPVTQMDCEYFEFVKLQNIYRFLEDYQPDCAILHSFYYLEYNQVVKALRRQKIPYLIEPHGSFGKKAMEKSFLKKWIANRSLFRNQLKYAEGFVFLNEAEKRESVYRTNQDIMIANGIDEQEIYPEIINQKDCQFYFIGRYDINHKGLDYLLEALRILEKEAFAIKVNFWGKGSPKTLDYMKEKTFGFKSVQVQISGPIWGSQKNEALEQIGPMLLTSRYEGFPMTVLEGWAYGNPCVVTVGTNVSEEVEAYHLGWVTPLDAISIAKTIQKAYQEYMEDRQGYAQACKNYVKDTYEWASIAKKSLEDLKELLNKD